MDCDAISDVSLPFHVIDYRKGVLVIFFLNVDCKQ